MEDDYGSKCENLCRAESERDDQRPFLLCGSQSGRTELAGRFGDGEQTRALIAELEQDIVTVDGLIAFAGSEAGAKVFGEEMAGKVKAHGEELKEAGAKYCDCPACAAVAAILEKKEEMF